MRFTLLTAGALLAAAAVSTFVAPLYAGGGVTYDQFSADPYRRVAALSLAEREVDGQQVAPLHFYVFTPHNECPISAEEIASVIRDLIEPDSWEQETGVYLKAVNNRVLVRHRIDVQRRIHKLLRSLGAIPGPEIRGGPYFGGPIPVVGRRD